MADEHGGHRWQQLAVDLLLGVTVGVVVSVLLQRIVDHLRIPFSSNASLVLLALSAAVLATIVLLLVVLRTIPWTRPLSWAALSALGTVPLAVLLHGSRFYLNGVSGDQSFRMQYLTRFAQSPELADMNYADLPPFYPAGWFWLGGRLAALFGIPGWAAYKPFALVTMAVAPVIAFGLWSVVVRRPVAFVHAVLTCLVGVRTAAYEPYAWLVAANIPPMAVVLWQSLRRAVGVGPRDRMPVLGFGLFLGVCGAVYTLLFGFVSLMLVAFAACALLARWWVGDTQQLLRSAAAVGRDVLVIAVVAAPLVLAVWTPYFVRLARTGSSGANAVRFLPEVGALIPTPMLEFAVSGALCLLGLAWIVFAWRTSEVAQGLGLLVACCYAWYLLSFLALARHATLLPFKLESVLVTALFCGAGSAAFDGLRWVAWRVPHRRLALLTSGALVAALALVDLVQTVRQAEERVVAPGIMEESFTAHDDTGASAQGPATPDDPGWWNGRVLAAVRELSGRPPQDQVMLTSEVQFLALRPYHGFQISDRTYANPLADFDGRRMLIDAWARSRDPEQFRTALDHSPFRPPTVFVLTREGAELRLKLSKDVFPRHPNRVAYQVSFPEWLFDPRYFLRRDVGPYAVLVRR